MAEHPPRRHAPAVPKPAVAPTTASPAAEVTLAQVYALLQVIDRRVKVLYNVYHAGE